MGLGLGAVGRSETDDPAHRFDLPCRPGQESPSIRNSPVVLAAGHIGRAESLPGKLGEPSPADAVATVTGCKRGLAPGGWARLASSVGPEGRLP